MPAISVVIPTHNVEKFVRRTLRSIKMQSFQDINVIVVDDASTDRTKEVVMKELKDVRFEWRVVEQNFHGGVSNARNIGLKIASGEYLHFLDGDDFIEPTFYEKMYNKAVIKAYDIVVSGFDEVTTDGLIVRRCLNNLFPEARGQQAFMAQLNLTLRARLCASLFRRKFLIKNSLHFIPERRYLEDTEFLLKALYKAKYVGVVPEALLHILRRHGSVTRSGNPEKFINDVLEAYTELRNFLEKEKCPENAKVLLKARIGTHILDLIVLSFVSGDYRVSKTMHLHSRSLIKEALTPKWRDKILKIAVLYCPDIVKMLYPLYKKFYVMSVYCLNRRLQINPQCKIYKSI